jgi:cell wall-associated NlpC family hydrolase
MGLGKNTVAYALLAASVAVAAAPGTTGGAAAGSGTGAAVAYKPYMGGGAAAPGTTGGAAAGSGTGAAIAYAKAQIGRPYLWGGTGPAAFDCSGLVMMAYQADGIHIARTSEAQWASQPHIPASQVKPGDLVFFPGSDGTAAAPGHVGIVVDPARDLMINAYASGYPVEYATFGPSASLPGLSDVVGFTRPL